MTEVRSGLRHALAFPIVYDLFQHVVGAYAWRRKVVERFVAPVLKQGATVIDIGCGTAEILNYLPASCRYVGFDRNPGYVNKAQKRHSNRKAEFFCRDLSSFSELPAYRAEAVLVFGLIHHLDDETSAEVFRMAKALLQVGGFLLALDPVYTDEQSKIARYVVSRDRGTAVRTAQQYAELAHRNFSSVETYIDQNPLHIPYTGIVLKCYVAGDC